MPFCLHFTEIIIIIIIIIINNLLFQLLPDKENCVHVDFLPEHCVFNEV